MIPLTFTEEEIRRILEALDFYSRIWIGQYDHILWEMRWMKDCDKLDLFDEAIRKKFIKMRQIILPALEDYPLSASFGIFSDKRDVKVAIAYDMQQEFRYKKAWFLHPEGGYTVDFGSPLPCEDDPCVFPKAECYRENGEFRIRVTIEEVQLSIMIDALQVRALADQGQMRKVFSYYTDDSCALSLADDITDIFMGIDTVYAWDRALTDHLLEKLKRWKTEVS